MEHHSITAAGFCRASSDSLAGFMSMPDGSTTFPSSPFALPPAYVSAWEGKMKSAAEVRAAVKSVSGRGWKGWLASWLRCPRGLRVLADSRVEPMGGAASRDRLGGPQPHLWYGAAATGALF